MFTALFALSLYPRSVLPSPISFPQVNSTNPRGSVLTFVSCYFSPTRPFTFVPPFFSPPRAISQACSTLGERPLPSNTYYLHFMAILQAKPLGLFAMKTPPFARSLAHSLAGSHDTENAMRYITISCALSRSRIANRSRSVRAHLRRATLRWQHAISTAFMAPSSRLVSQRSSLTARLKVTSNKGGEIKDYSSGSGEKGNERRYYFCRCPRNVIVFACNTRSFDRVRCSLFNYKSLDPWRRLEQS